MKIRISLLIVLLIVVFMTTFSYFAEALRSTGRDCYGTFSGNIFQDSSDSKIIENFEWQGLNMLNPRMVSVGYEEAKIFGKVRAYQNTFGRGLVGVLPSGSVSGPNFSMDLPQEFNIRSTSVISGTWDTTSMSTHKTRMTDEPGTYKVTGSADIMAVKGAGGITVEGTGLSGSGAIQFHVTETADPVTHTLTVKEKHPKSYECSHKACTVKLPHKHHHRFECSEVLYSECPSTTHHGDRICGEVYYLCQTTTCPNAGNHKVIGSCGHVYRQSDSSDHALLATCSSCNATSVYACSEHPENCTDSGSGSGSEQNGNGGGQNTNNYVNPGGNGGTPVSNGGCNTPPANGGCTSTANLVKCKKRYVHGCRDLVSDAREHKLTCPGCNEYYWTCNSSDVEEHGLRSCTRPRQNGDPCGTTWRRCAYEPYWQNGQLLGTAPGCSTATLHAYFECLGPVLP